MAPAAVAAVVLAAAAIAFGVADRVRQSRQLRRLRQGWGVPPTERRLQPELARRLHDLLGTSADPRVWTLDDRTWSDLDLDAAFVRLDHTLTPVGSQCLYRMLRTPRLDAEDLARRRTQLGRLRSDTDLRGRLLLALAPAGDPQLAHLAEVLWGEPPARSGWEAVVPLLAVAPLAAAAAAVTGVVGWAPAFVAAAFNIVVHFAHLQRVSELPLEQLGRLLAAASGVAASAGAVAPEACAAIGPGLARTVRARRRLSLLQLEDPLGLARYVRVLLLLDVSAWSAAADVVRTAGEELRSLLRGVGEVDAFLALASWLSTAGKLTVPEPTPSLDGAGFEDLRHPLIADPVPCSLDLDRRGVLVTGSNMSGKTTLLKSVGVNAVLAQTVGFAAAGRWTMPLMRPVTSIGRADNLIEGRSYYLAEVESVARMVRAAGGDAVHLFLADELFRGTNAVERVAGATAVLGHLAAHGDLVLAATHDLELGELLGETFRPVHFGEEVGPEGLRFDYRLQPGIATGRTALALLELTGYPKPVVAEARRLVTTLEGSPGSYTRARHEVDASDRPDTAG